MSEGEPEKETELFKPKVGACEMPFALAGVGRFYQRFEHVQGGRLYSVAKQEFLRGAETSPPSR